ncbi:MAG TPA: peptidoglycan DD-metalloendopeptidase family protein [Sphingomicrobium sp.]|nr:peptidoglycan DD-metalloendopeptidase family protein [Sphingomicrobium sp.]
MTRLAPLLLFAPLLLAASAPVPTPAEPLDAALKRARTEQATADAETRRLERIASGAQSEAARLQAREAAAANAIEAAEARISAADALLRITSTAAERQSAQLRREQQPIASLLSGLAMMARRPPLLAIADRGSTDDLVKVRVLLDSTLPVIRSRTAALSGQLARGRRLESDALAAKQELQRSRENLVARREQFASLEAQALKSFESARGQALATGDVALAAGEDIEQLRGSEAGSRAAFAIASELADSDPAPVRPLAPDGRGTPPLPYQLPGSAAVTEGLGSVNAHGVRSRGLTLATSRGVILTVPASGIVRFSGPFRSHDGVVIIDHGKGWMSLIVGVASPLKAGDRVTLGDPLGRALGPIEVELSQNGRRVSPALIAGSSQTLSNGGKGR